MANKDMFNMLKSNFKRLYPNATTEQFINYLRTKHKEIYKFAERTGLLKQLPAPTTGADVTAKNTGKKSPVTTQQQPQKTNNAGQKQITGSSPKLLTGNSKQTATNPNLDELYKNRKTTIDGEKDILGKGSGKATSASSLADKMNKLKSGIKATPKAVGGAIARYALPVLGAGETIRNWNAEGSTPQTRALDIAGDLGAFGGAIINPLWGNIGGQVLSYRNKGMADKQREWNAMQQNDSVKALTPEQQAAVARYQQTGVGGQLPTSEEDALKMQLYGTTDVNGGTVPLDYPNISSYPRNPEIENYTGSVGGTVSGNGAGVPPSQGLIETGDSDNNNSNNAPALAPVPQQAQGMPQGMTGGAAPYTMADYEADKQAIMRGENANPYTQGVQQANEAANKFLSGEGYVSQQDIYNKLQETMNQRPEYVDPRYQGDIIPAQGYQVSPAEARWAASLDASTKAYNSAFGTNKEAGNLQNLYNNSQLMYEMQMANKAGVPYPEYKQAMLDRYTNQILQQTAEANNLLKFQAQQTADATQRRELIAAIQKNYLDAHQKINEAKMKADTDIQTSILSGLSNVGVANINAQADKDVQNMRNIGDIQRTRETLQSEEARNRADNLTKLKVQQMLLSDPNKYINSISNLMEAQSYLTPDQMVAMLSGLSPQGRARIFGRDLSVNELGELFNAIRSNDNGFSLQAFFNRLRGTGNNAE